MNPDLLPKIRSDELMEACNDIPVCTLRIASFLGMPCAPYSTVVGCHLPTIGKGVSTKVSDLYVAAGCRLCHDLLDLRDKRGVSLMEMPDFWVRVMRAHHETQGYWVGMGLIEVRGGRLV